MPGLRNHFTADVFEKRCRSLERWDIKEFFNFVDDGIFPSHKCRGSNIRSLSLQGHSDTVKQSAQFIMT
jgi:hypothetical protein